MSIQILQIIMIKENLCVHTCRMRSKLVIQGSYPDLQGNYLDAKVNWGTLTQATTNYCVLWQSKCLAHYKESNFSFKNESHRHQISFCLRISGGEKCGYAEDLHQW